MRSPGAVREMTGSYCLYYLFMKKNYKMETSYFEYRGYRMAILIAYKMVDEFSNRRLVGTVYFFWRIISFLYFWFGYSPLLLRFFIVLPSTIIVFCIVVVQLTGNCHLSLKTIKIDLYDTEKWTIFCSSNSGKP